MDKISLWEIVRTAPPEFWAGVAVGAFFDKLIRSYRSVRTALPKGPADSQESPKEKPRRR